MAQLFNADEIYSIGVQIEQNGFQFYARAAEKSEDTDLRDLFNQLAGWESKHVTLFESLRLKLPQIVRETDVYDAENMVHRYLKAVADDNVFVKGLTLVLDDLVWDSPITILNTALDFEKDSVVFFSSMKELVREDLGKKEMDRLVLEELRHIGFVTAELKKLGGDS